MDKHIKEAVDRLLSEQKVKYERIYNPKGTDGGFELTWRYVVQDDYGTPIRRVQNMASEVVNGAIHDLKDLQRFGVQSTNSVKFVDPLVISDGKNLMIKTTEFVTNAEELPNLQRDLKKWGFEKGK